MTGRQMLFRDLVADGFFVDELRESEQKGVLIGRQEGRLEERQEIFVLLDKGYSVEEVKKRLQPA
jgi:predicted transposase YdaD